MSCPEAYVNVDGQGNFSGQNKSSYSGNYRSFNFNIWSHVLIKDCINHV